MNREMLVDHVKLAERHVNEGERILKHQREVVAHLRRDQHSQPLIDSAETLLRSFEDVQRMHLEDLARLRTELGLGVT